MDRAQAVNEDFQAFALAAQRQSQNPADYSSTGTLCADCGDEIPEGRRLAMPGCRYCVSCQGQHEIHFHWRAL